MSQDILSNFNADSREVTDAKIQAMRDAKLDTTQIEKQVAVLRQQDAAYKAQLKADSLAQQSAGKETYGYAHDTPINKLVGSSIDAPQTVGGLYYSIPGVDQVKLIPELPTRPNDGSFVDWLAIAPNSVNNVINTAIGIVNGGATEINYLIDNGPSNMMKAYANAFISMKEGVKNAIGNEIDYQTNTPIGQKANDAIDLWSSPGYYETLGTIGLDIAITKGLSTISMPGKVNDLLGSVSRAEKLPMDELSNVNKAKELAGLNAGSLNYLPTSGVRITATEGKTTTIFGNYKSDMTYIIDELGIKKNTDFGAKPGGFNVLNVQDELYQNPKQFWNEYNKPFQDAAIKRDDLMPLATRPQFGNPYVKDSLNNMMKVDSDTNLLQITGFGREYLNFKKNGYVYDANKSEMIKLR